MKKKFIFFFLLGVYFAACTPTVESESKAWESNQLKAKELSTQYPAYATFLSETLNKAQNIWKEAATINDEKLKAEKMSQANDLLESGPVNQLSEAKSLIEDINSNIRDLNNLLVKYPDYNENGMIAIQNAQSYINEMNGYLFPSGEVFTAAQAINSINMMSEKGKLAQSGISIILDQLMQMESANNNDTVSTSSSDQQKEQATEKQCEYCKKMNNAEVHECKFCGAPMSK